MTDIKIIHSECLAYLRTIPDNTFDSIVTDPPYGLKFMAKKWDYDVPSTQIWAECLRVLKPGGYLLAFAGTRTQHRMAVRIEDAGFEIRDMIAWVYGSGYPKSVNVGKEIDKHLGAKREVVGTRNNGAGNKTGETIFSDDAYNWSKEIEITILASAEAEKWDGYGTGLKPALEPITVARKPLDGTIVANILKHGAGAINIDGCRVATDEKLNGGAGGLLSHQRDDKEYQEAGNGHNPNTLGRWPANLIHDGSDEVLAQFPTTASGKANIKRQSGTEFFGNSGAAYGDESRPAGTEMISYGDKGSAARFFKQTEVTDSEWLENLSPALIAGSTLSLSKLADAIAQSDAAISALPGGRQLNVLKAPSTSVTPSESKLIATSVITAIQSIASASLLAQQPERLSLSHSHVSVVAHQTPTGTTTITASLSSSAGCAESITFSITPKNLVVGGMACEQSSDRFMYCAKASPTDRNEGCDDLPAKSAGDMTGGRKDGSAGLNNPRAGAGRTSGGKNFWPTVKPTELMRYLVKLVTPQGGRLLDPFCGSGSTGKACAIDGVDCTLIDMDEEAVMITEARVSHAAGRTIKRDPTVKPPHWDDDLDGEWVPCASQGRPVDWDEDLDGPWTPQDHTNDDEL